MKIHLPGPARLSKPCPISPTHLRLRPSVAVAATRRVDPTAQDEVLIVRCGKKHMAPRRADPRVATRPTWRVLSREQHRPLGAGSMTGPGKEPFVACFMAYYMQPLHTPIQAG